MGGKFAGLGWALAMLIAATIGSSRAAAQSCLYGGRMTFESSEAIDAWTFIGNGGIDYGQRNFLPTHQARNGNEPEYVNNGWLFGSSGWLAMERVLHGEGPIGVVMMTPYLQGSSNLPPIQVALLDADTGALLAEKTVDVSRPGRYSEFYLNYALGSVARDLIVRFGFWAPNADAWLRVGSVDFRYFASTPTCGPGTLAELR